MIQGNEVGLRAFRMCETYIEKNYKWAVKDLKSTKMTVGVVRVSGTLVPVLETGIHDGSKNVKV
jgi:hypothetical protein